MNYQPNSMEVYGEHLAALEKHLTVSCDGLEATNNRLSDLIHFLKRTILEVREVDAQAQIEREKYEKEKAMLQQEFYQRKKGSTSSEKTQEIREHPKLDAKADTKEEDEKVEGAPSLEDILNKARTLRESKVNRDIPPPFVSGGSGSRTKKIEKPASKMGPRTAPKKAPGKTSNTIMTRRPLHEAKSAPRRATADKLNTPKRPTTSSGSKSVPKSPPKKKKTLPHL